MTLKKIMTVFFGVAIVLPSIGFSEDYKQMLAQAQDQGKNESSKSTDNMMGQYQSHKKSGQAEAESIFKQDDQQSY